MRLPFSTDSHAAELNFRRFGEGEPLVLVHGIGGELYVWELVLEPLAARMDVIAVDLPGFGHSPPIPDGPPSRQLAERLGLDRLVRPVRLAVPGARTVVLRGCGHIPMWDWPALVTDLILETASTASGGVALAGHG